VIVGFVSSRDLSRLARGSDAIELTIYPDAEGDATEVVAIGYAQIAQHRQYSIRNAAGMSLRVRPHLLVSNDSSAVTRPGPHVAP
jgi:hypothetical protein